MTEQKEGREPINVLIVEDDPSAAELVVTALSMIDKAIHPVRATTSAEAIQMLENPISEIRLIILDLDLETSGAGLAVLCKSSETPIMVVTGRGAKDLDKEIVLSAGAFSFFPKPLELKTFTREVRNLLRHTNAPPQIYRFPGSITYDMKNGMLIAGDTVCLSLGEASKLAFDRLAKSYPAMISTSDLLEYVYHDANENRNLLYNVISRLRESLKENKIPLEIQSLARGRKSGGYWLVAVDPID